MLDELGKLFLLEEVKSLRQSFIQGFLTSCVKSILLGEENMKSLKNDGGKEYDNEAEIFKSVEVLLWGSLKKATITKTELDTAVERSYMHLPHSLDGLDEYTLVDLMKLELINHERTLEYTTKGKICELELFESNLLLLNIVVCSCIGSLKNDFIIHNKTGTKELSYFVARMENTTNPLYLTSLTFFPHTSLHEQLLRITDNKYHIRSAQASNIINIIKELI